MKIKKHIMTPLQSNCYVVWDEASRKALVIDPAFGIKKIQDTITDKNLTLMAIIQTHSHWDHRSGTLALQKKTGAPLYRHPLEPRTGAAFSDKRADGSKVVDLSDGDDVRLGALDFQVIHTPGHSPGSICLFGEDVLFSGDLLFKGGVGRTDLKGGSIEELVRSLNHRTAHLPDDIDVLPGHGPATTLGQERRNNPFLRIPGKMF
jgi:glyoxylase-like metal-dependent hydrolase (beta-lactamase superfamily II)